MGENAFDIFGGTPDAQASAQQLADAIRGKRQRSSLLNLSNDPGAMAQAAQQNTQSNEQEGQLGQAGQAAPYVGLRQALLAAQGRKEGAEGSALMPRAALGGKTTQEFDALTRRMGESQWELAEDKLIPGGAFLRNKHDPTKAFYLDQDGVRPLPFQNGQHTLPPASPQGQPPAAPAAGAPQQEPQLPPGARMMGNGLVHPSTVDAVEQALVKQMPAEEQKRYITAGDVIANAPRVLDAVEKNKNAFGMLTNLSGAVPDALGPLKGAVSTFQQNHRTPEALQARRLVQEDFANTARAYAGARGFAQGELPIWANLAPDVSGGDNAKVIKAKVEGALKDAQFYRARLRATFMKQLPPETTAPQKDAAAAALEKYGGK